MHTRQQSHSFPNPCLIKLAQAVSAACMVLAVSSTLAAAPTGVRGVPSTATPATPSAARTAPPVRAQFNRQTVGATSGVNAALRHRAYAVLDKQTAAGGAPIGLRTHGFANDGRNGTPALPRTAANGQAITYQTTYLRPNTAGRSYANARVTQGSDGRAYLSRHHGDKGGQVKRIQ